MVQATRLVTFAAIAFVSFAAAQDTGATTDVQPPTEFDDTTLDAPADPTTDDLSSLDDGSEQAPVEGEDVTAPTDISLDDGMGGDDDLLTGSPTDGSNSTATDDVDSTITPTDIDDDDFSATNGTSTNTTTTATDDDETTTTISTRTTTRSNQDQTDEPTPSADDSGAANIYAPAGALVVPLILITFFA